MNWRTILAISTMVAASCGGPQRGGEVERVPLGQARAVEILEEVVSEREVGGPTRNVSARLGNNTSVNVDVLILGLGAGFVYLNEQDRHNIGALPPQSDRSELYAVRGELPRGQSVVLLVVQDTDFVYLPNPRPDNRQPEDRTIDDVEARLRRDARDFLQAVVDIRGGGPE